MVLAKPRSYMNESGGPIVAVSRFYKIGVERIVVVHDELDLPFGAVRLKRGGGEGGHNGLKSTSAALGSKDYLRVRFGIGRPPGRQDPADYVLREFAAAERKDLGGAVRPGRRRGGGGAGQGPGGGPERVPLLSHPANRRGPTCAGTRRRQPAGCAPGAIRFRLVREGAAHRMHRENDEGQPRTS